jgi:hypothetical protein
MIPMTTSSSISVKAWILRPGRAGEVQTGDGKTGRIDCGWPSLPLNVGMSKATGEVAEAIVG